jgi:prophage regulatory protein
MSLPGLGETRVSVPATIPRPHTILRLPAVLQHCGYSRSTLYEQIAQGLWPRPVRVGLRAVGWPAGEVALLIGARIAGGSDDEIRQLVSSLTAARREALSAQDLGLSCSSG